MHRISLLFEPLFDVCDACSDKRGAHGVDMYMWPWDMWTRGQQVARGSVVLW